MWDTKYVYQSNSSLPESTSQDVILSLLHDFDTIIHLNPTCRGVKTVPEADANTHAAAPPVVPDQPWSEYRVEDSISFIPKRLWDGGVWYSAWFQPVQDGCNIKVAAPGGFISVNEWRLHVREDGERSVVINSDAKGNMVFMPFVRRFVPGSHASQHRAFKERVEAMSKSGSEGSQEKEELS